MSTLDDLLALLPDNTTGAIDAEDLRTIVTALWDNDAALYSTGQSELQALKARVSALEETTNTHGASFPFTWATNGNPPSNKHMTMDQPWQTFATKVMLSETALDDTVLTFTVLDSAISARLYLTTADGAKLTADVTGPTVDQGTYREIPVHVLSTEGDPPSNNEDVTYSFVAVLP